MWNREEAVAKARKMLDDGVDVNEIMGKTRLRLKDVKKIENELSKRF